MEETENIGQATPAGHGLIRHSVFNAIGQGVPIAVAIVAVPMILHRIGTERLGLLTIAWAVIGYGSLFDFGLGRALTQVVAERRHQHDEALVRTVWSALVVMAAIGVLMGAAMLAASGWIVTRSLHVSPELLNESRQAFQLLALGLPVVVVTTGLRGILEAYERFDLVNMVRVPIGVSTFVGPLLAAFFTPSLAASVGLLLIGRIAGLVVHAVLTRRTMPELHPSVAFDGQALARVAKFGAWLTVSNLLSPFMLLADRFLIGSFLSASVVAYYTAPQEMVTRVMALVAVAVATTLFPAFARWRGMSEARGLFARGVRLTAIAFVPLVAVLIVFAPRILTRWLGGDFAAHSADVLRILGIGAIMNGLAQVPFAHIQAVRRADLTAKIHIAEVPAYLAVLVYLVRTHGIEGAATAWTLRQSVDMLLMFATSRRLLAATPADVVVAEPA